MLNAPKGKERQALRPVESNVSRNLSFEKFQSEHSRQRRELTAYNARESGRALAEALVGRRQRVSDLSAEAKQRMLKRYCVPASLSAEFFAACDEAFDFERGFQLNCVN